MTRLPHHPSSEHPNNIWWRVQTMELIVIQFSPHSYDLSLLGQKILLSTFFSNTLNMSFP
jgi:hypothetical protein